MPAQPTPTAVATAKPAARSDLAPNDRAERLNDTRFSLRDRQQMAALLARNGNSYLQGVLPPDNEQRSDFEPERPRAAAPSPSGPTPAPATGSGGAPAGTGLGAAVEAVLNISAQGRFALATLQKYGVTLKFGPKNNPQYSPDTNECQMNSGMSPEVSAAYFIHEMHHAYMHHTSQSLDAKTMADTAEGRDRFIEQHVTEEVVGTIKGIEGVLVFDASGAIQDEPGKRSVPCYRDYLSAFNYNFNQQRSRGATVAVAQAIAHKLARLAVRTYFDDPEGLRIKYKPFGGVLTYHEHYAREWDSVQRSKTGRP